MEGIGIPESVAMEILSRLPVKSLVRFRCVCKHWYSSFQASYFITKHYHNNLNNNNLDLLLKRTRVRRLPCNYNIYFSSLSTEKGQNFEAKEDIHLPIFEDCCLYAEICGPCNGLLCLHYRGKAAIWNPSTREFKMIPKSTPAVKYTLLDSFGIGFGYDSTTDDYKIVRFVLNNRFDENKKKIDQVELYSLKSDSWKKFSLPESIPYINTRVNQYINGFCYWLTEKRSEKLILSFDMVNEKFSTLSLPTCGVFSARYEDKLCKLLNFNGLLGAIIYEREGAEKSLDLWVMNGTWTRQFSIESIPGVEKPLGFWKDGEIFLESLNGELMVLDPTSKEVKNLGVDAYQFEMEVIVYVESLVPINGRSEHGEHIIRQPAESKDARAEINHKRKGQS